MKLFAKWRKASVPAAEKTFVPAGPAKTDSDVGKGRKILVVDDDSVVLKTFVMKLGACGFEVLTATDGAAAVSVARQARPDVVVLDINFPPDVGNSGMSWNGFTIMQWMRRFQEVSSTPIMIITSGDPATLKSKAMANGAVAFFQKPIPFDELLLAVGRAISQGSGQQTTLAPQPA
ncbi:MAG TPA: response regulator [Verrucomicrobiae bacterium]|nr:response regulator [Verrucomicrobiae bacterium]